jgi:hypothetical protein
MQKVSFHRRILPWVFVIVFLAIAPSVVFYTAGYRWNPKKGALERNGTIIIDTTPDGASILLNGKLLDDQSPVTLQRTAPGTYEIRLELDGYHPWSKTLDVRPELVTFVNEVRLWPDVEPELVAETRAALVAASPNGRTLSYASEGENGASVSFFDLSSNKTDAFTFGSSSTAAELIRWSGESSSVYIRCTDGSSWVVRRTGTDGPLELPAGSYRWEDGMLIGSVDGGRYVYDAANGRVEREDLAYGVLDVNGSLRLMSSTSSPRLALTDASKPGRMYELPNGDWRFGPSYNGFIFLTSDDEWLGFDPDADEPAALRIPVSGDTQYMKISGDSFILSRHLGEIWITDLEPGEPELAVRTSREIKAAFWFRAGTDVFYATDNKVIALNLDPRDGRMETVLAEFDEIFDMALANRVLYVAARRGEERGIFRLRVES